MSAVAEKRAGMSALPTVVRWAGAAVFVLSVPLFLITTNAWQTTNDRGVYERGFARYGVSQRTTLTASQLREVAGSLIAYFNAPPGRLDIEVDLRGSRWALFNEREIAHMEDVQQLMHLVRRLQLLTGVTLLLIPLAVFSIDRRAAFPVLSRLCLAGAGLTATVLVFLGGLSLVDFSDVFVRFHQLSFNNDLWMLDPDTDYLLMLFPEGFWFDATIRIASLTAIEALALAGLGLALRFWGRRP